MSSATDQLLTALLERAVQRGLTSPASSLVAPTVGGDGTAGLSAGDLVAVLGGTRSSLLALSTSAARLDSASLLSVFYTGAASTTDASAITASVVPGISPSTAVTRGSYHVTVSQVAVAQVNQGTALTTSATSSFTTGTNTIRITQNGASTDVSFSVGASDTNGTVLAAMAAAINATSGLGVTAAVVTDATAGTSQLAITSSATGTGNAFTVSNVAGTPVTDAGVGSASTAAKNAIFAVDGTTYTQNGNEVYLGTSGNVHLTLVGTSSTPVVIGVGPDTGQITAAVNGLVSDFNQAQAFFSSNPGVLSGAASQLAAVVARSSAQLRSVGIDVGADGTLSIDSARLSSVLASGASTLRAALGDVGGFAKEVHAIADVQLAIPAAARDPLPPFQSGTTARLIAGAFASALHRIDLRGALVDALL